MIDPDSIPRLITAGTIEIAPAGVYAGQSVNPIATPVLTPDGFRPIGSLTVGDLVIGSNGEPTPVIGVYPQGEKDIYRVTTQDGASTLASGDHLWAVATRDDRRRGKPLRVLTTREMIGNLRANHYHRYELPHAQRARLLPVPGSPDGPLRAGAAARRRLPDREHHPELRHRRSGARLGAAAAAARHPGPAQGRPNYQLSQVTSPWSITALVENPVTGAARRLGLYGTRSTTKFVPDLYLYNSAKVRLAVLQGLLDTDGGPVHAARTGPAASSTRPPRRSCATT